MGKPTWAKEATAALTAVSKDYRESLNSIAEGLAQHHGSERVLEMHVKEAFHILAAAGNNRKRWYERHELEIGLGGTLIGASCSVPDFISGFAPDDGIWRRAIVCAVMIAMLLIGIGLVAHGWMRVKGFFTTAAPTRRLG